MLPDGQRVEISHPEPTAATQIPDAPPPQLVSDWGATRPAPLGTICGARSGDKGGNANVGLWARDDRAFQWLDQHLDVDLFRRLLPEADALAVRRHRLPNLRALNFVVEGILGDGVASSTRFDAQAKGLGEYVRSRTVDLPVALLGEATGS